MAKICTKGCGIVKTKADAVEVNITVSGINFDYDKALSEAAEFLNEVKACLKKAGFEENSLKTAHFDVSKRTEQIQNEEGIYKNKFIGYECRYDNILRFPLDMQRLSDTISLLSKCSAFPSFDVRFTFEDTVKIKKKLLRAAFEDAKSSAEALAEAAGGKLSKLLSIDYSANVINIYSDTSCNMPAGRMLFKAEAIDITPEDIENTESVVAEWEMG